MTTLQPRTTNIRFNISYKEVRPLLDHVINMLISNDPEKFKHLRLVVNKYILPKLEKFKDENKETAGDKFLIWLTSTLSDADISQANLAASMQDNPIQRDPNIYLIKISLQNFYRLIEDEKKRRKEQDQTKIKNFLAAKRKANATEKEEETAAKPKQPRTPRTPRKPRQPYKGKKAKAIRSIKRQEQEAVKMQAQQKAETRQFLVHENMVENDDIFLIMSRLVDLYTYLRSNDLFAKERAIRQRLVDESSPDVAVMYDHLQELTQLLKEQDGIQLIITGGYATYLLTGYRTTDIDITIRRADLPIVYMRDLFKKEFSKMFDKTKYTFVSNLPGRKLLEEEESSDIIPETIQTRMGAVPILDITFSRDPIDDTELEKRDGVYLYNPHKLIDNLLLATNNFANRIDDAEWVKDNTLVKPESIYPQKVLSWFLQLQKLFYLVYPQFKKELGNRIHAAGQGLHGDHRHARDTRIKAEQVKTRRKKKTGGKRKTRKRGGRKGPEDSATKFSVGIKKTGNDGNIWVITKNKNGVKRWQRTNNKSKKKTTRKIFKSKKDKITVKILRALKKKYSVTTTGNKKEMAEGLWVVRGGSISDDDLQKIIPLLSKRDRKEAEKLLSERKTEPVSNYKGMWKPLPKPLSKMSRKELIKHLRSFRDVWESETGRNQDLSDERLKEESDKNLRELLEFYFSNEAKQMAGDWLRKNKEN